MPGDLASAPQETSFVALELTVEEGQMTPLHVHGSAESFRVLDGALVVHAGGSTARLRAGDRFTAPAGIPHAVGGGPGGARYVASSRVRAVEGYADFQRAVAVPDGLPEPAEDQAVVAELARANGITVLGPPGSLFLADRLHSGEST